MKKYRVTEKHGGYKEGIIIKYNKDDFKLFKSDGITYLWMENGDDLVLDDWLNDGWIVEIQEPEFTRDEVRSILLYNTDLTYNEAEAEIGIWTKRNKKQ